MIAMNTPEFLRNKRIALFDLAAYEPLLESCGAIPLDGNSSRSTDYSAILADLEAAAGIIHVQSRLQADKLLGLRKYVVIARGSGSFPDGLLEGYDRLIQSGVGVVDNNLGSRFWDKLFSALAVAISAQR